MGLGDFIIKGAQRLGKAVRHVTRARRSCMALVREPRFILLFQAKVSKRFYLSKAKASNVRDFAAAKCTVRECVYTLVYFLKVTLTY